MSLVTAKKKIKINCFVFFCIKAPLTDSTADKTAGLVCKIAKYVKWKENTQQT
jgi:hypothetical protein